MCPDLCKGGTKEAGSIGQAENQLIVKTKEQVKIEGKPVFYAVLYDSMRRAALECGYALALHGSMQSDMDLMAMPWNEDAAPEEQLVKALDDCIGETVWKDMQWKHRAVRAHARVVYTIS